LVFVEVKVVDNVDDLYQYITKNKLNYLQKTIDSFLQIFEEDYEIIRLDVVFVKNQEIYKIYENIEL
jgi:Holliday junction resolvase-like predicted endonuclease